MAAFSCTAAPGLAARSPWLPTCAAFAGMRLDEAIAFIKARRQEPARPTSSSPAITRWLRFRSAQSLRTTGSTSAGRWGEAGLPL